ncbi:MAG TPA: aspartate/glutamate racemase family protein [Ktedonobacterales bacterium]|nr:aspartate/glutamate racemase family protein [Ktedonobacterales bacterium]
MSIIDLVIHEVRQHGWKYVGVLGFGESTVYLTPLQHLDIGCETISAALSRQLDQAILAVMEGHAGPKEQSLARIAIERMRLQQVDGTILGCTEIPLLEQERAEAIDFINPLQLLAEAAIRVDISENVWQHVPLEAHPQKPWTKFPRIWVLQFHPIGLRDTVVLHSLLVGWAHENWFDFRTSRGSIDAHAHLLVRKANQQMSSTPLLPFELVRKAN